MNDEAGNAEFASITSVVEVERDVNVNTLSTNLTCQDVKIFLRVVTTEKGTLSKGVTEKDTRTGLGSSLWEE